MKNFGGCWASDLNWNASVIATGDQFGQIYIFPFNERAEEQNTHIIQAQVSRRIMSSSKNYYRSIHSMVTCVTFNHSSHRQWLAICCQNSRRFEIFDINKCAVVQNISKGIYKNIRDIRWYSKNETYLCIANDDKNILVYDPRESDSRKCLTLSLVAHQSSCTSVDFGPQQIIGSCSTDGSMKLWNLENEKNKYLCTFNDHSDQMWKLRFNYGKDRLATVGDDGCLCLYSLDFKGL